MKWTARVARTLGACSVAFMAFLPLFDIPVHAVDTVTLTPAQTRALFGDTLSGSYYDSTTGDYVSTNFTYLTTTYVKSRSSMRDSYAVPFDRIAPTGTPLLIYQSDVQGITTDSNRNYYTVKLEPFLNLGMLQRFCMVAGFSTTAYYMHEDENDETSPMVWKYNIENCAENRGGYPMNYWDILQNGNRVHGSSADSWTTNSNILDWLHWAVVGTSQANQRFFIPNIIDISSDSFFSVSDISITRQGSVRAIDSANGRTLLYITPPILSQDYIDNSQGGETGTDLTATNQKLDTIIQILSYIANQQNNSSGSDVETPEGNANVNSANNQFSDADDDSQSLAAIVSDYAISEDIYDIVDSDGNTISFDIVDHVDNLPDLAPAADVIDAGATLVDALDMDEEISPMMPMMLIALSISLISYIIFGKWV